MKFGNYNLTTGTENKNRLYIFRIKRVKNTANYIVGKFNHKINTIRTISKINNLGKKKRKVLNDSPLSYRASLFDKENFYRPLEKQEGEMIEIKSKNEDQEYYEKYEKYTPTDFYNHHSLLFSKNEKKSLSEPCVFDKVKFSNINNAISGKRQHKMLKNVYFTIKTTNIQNLYEPTRFEIIQRNSMRKKKQNNVEVASNKDVDYKRDLSALLHSANPDEKTEYEILKDYFDSMSFTDIVKDKDFKTYLKHKNYQDAIDYIYSGSLFSRGDRSSLYSEMTKKGYYSSITSDLLKRYYDIDLDIITESNDCDSIKNEKEKDKHHHSKKIDRRKYYNKENSQFFCKSNKEFDDYYKRNTKIFYEANKKFDDDFFRKDVSEYYKTCDRYKEIVFKEDNESEIDELYNNRSNPPHNYSTMPVRKSKEKEQLRERENTCCRNRKCQKGAPQKPAPIDSFEDENDDITMFTKYQTYPLKKKTKKNYTQILKYCEKSLTTYTTIDRKLDKWKKCYKKEYSEKNYNKIIKAFVKLRGFDSVDSYIQYHYGRILDKSFDVNLKARLKETLAAYEDDVGEVGKRQKELVISKPILTTTTQSAALSVTHQNNSRRDSLPPPYTSGSFFNEESSSSGYFYKKHRPSPQQLRAKMKLDDYWAYEDCFKNYNYVETLKKTSPSDESSGTIDSKRVLFKFMEDMQENHIKLEHLLDDRIHIKSAIDRYNNTNYYKTTKTNTNCKSKIDCYNSNKSKTSKANEASDDNVYESIYVESNNFKNAFKTKLCKNYCQQYIDEQRKQQQSNKQQQYRHVHKPIVIF